MRSVATRIFCRRPGSLSALGMARRRLRRRFAVPFVLADVLEINRDLFYGLYALAVFGLFALWSRSTGYDLVAAVNAAGSRRPARARGGRRPGRDGRPNGGRDGTTRGRTRRRSRVARILYGITDGLFLSVFPILVVFAALAGTGSTAVAGKVVIGVVALAASLAMTAIYHSGYSDFRSDKMTKPLGCVIWSVPTLLTLNPIGAPIAHAVCTRRPCCTATRRTRSCPRTGSASLAFASLVRTPFRGLLTTRTLPRRMAREGLVVSSAPARRCHPD